MSLGEIDRALAAWDTRLAAVAENLLELQGEATYRLLTGSGGAAKLRLEGITASRVDPALGAMLGMFQHFGELRSTVERARQLRSGLPALFGADNKLREIEHLLLGKCIQLDTQDVPFDQRTLLSGVRVQDCLSMDEMLAAMSKAFSAARDAVLAIDRTWEELAAGVEAAEARLRACGGRPPRETADLERIVGVVRNDVQADPFGALQRLDREGRPLLLQLEQMAEARRQVEHEISRGRVQLRELGELQGAAIEAAETTRAKIADCGGLPAPLAEGAVRDLALWLDRLEHRREDMAASVGIKHWRAAAEGCLRRARACAEAHRAQLDTRDELRGRLEALKAKARAYGVAEGEELAAQAQTAEGLLYARPTPVAQAAAAVAAYEKILSRRSRPSSI